ncbi:MAG: hypothetical protein IJR00_08785 [Lachnospiraceae bacterium]|nr:hypothetical protein [Lachnospiraceae bacterium]
MGKGLLFLNTRLFKVAYSVVCSVCLIVSGLAAWDYIALSTAHASAITVMAESQSLPAFEGGDRPKTKLSF